MQVKYYSACCLENASFLPCPRVKRISFSLKGERVLLSYSRFYVSFVKRHCQGPVSCFSLVHATDVNDIKLSGLERNDTRGKCIEVAESRTRGSAGQTAEKNERPSRSRMAERSHVIIGYPVFVPQSGNFFRSRYADSSRSYLSSIPDFRHLQSYPTYRSTSSVIFISSRCQPLENRSISYLDAFFRRYNPFAILSISFEF